ncbi:hypothetical protein QZH41_004729 [Actinostola sp. cb2023]|nr:hypothetical protein QZH41_004729 [Actinostola sp. cb2023]
MLLWNKSEDLRNGSQGVFLDMETASVAVVRFPGVGVVNVGKETWLKRDRYGVVVGSVTQVPLVPCYAITCHKSQGQTVPAVIVHCSQEFVSSLTYVALSRVKSADHLQVINFKPKFLAAAPQAVTSECWTTSPEEIEKEDLTCCRNQELMDSSLFCATDRTFGNHNDNIPEEALVNFPPSAVDDDFLKNIFEEECQQIISLVEVNATLQEHEEELSQPPESLNRNDLLSSLKSPEARAGTTGHAKNLLLDSLQLTEDEHTHEKLIAFLKVIWNHLFNIVDNHTAENLDETITKITRQQFTAATGDLHAFFKSQEYKAYLHDLFGVSALTKVQSMVGGDIVLSLYTRFLAHLADKVHQDGHDVEDEEPFSVWNMTDEGKAKVRYVGGWALRKVMEKSRHHIKDNMQTKVDETMSKVEKSTSKVELIQDELCVQYMSIATSSKYQATLDVTESRQYRERGLIHISDEAFEFFMLLEQNRVEMLNKKRLRNLGSEMIEKTLEEMKGSDELNSKWKDCFDEDSSILYSQELKEEVFKEVVTRHVHMGANQFLRDFRLEYKIRKTAELRKRVLQRQKKAKERQDMVKFEIFEKAFDVGRTFFHLWRKPSTKTRRFHKSHQSVGFLCKTSSDCQGKARRIVIVDLDNEASTFDVHRNFCISG